MFNLLNSTVLLAAAAALIPLIIHLFSRRRMKVVEFSSLRHLKSMQRRQVRRLRLRQLLLLLLRMLIILIVVLAFARPTSRTGALGSHAAVSAAILIDNSASMNRYVTDGNLFDIARTRTEQLLASFGQSDRVALIPIGRPTGGEGVVPALASAATALEKLERVQVGWGAADLETALGVADGILAGSPDLNRELYLVSDRQRNSLPEERVLRQSAAGFYLVDLPLEANGNCGVVAIDFGGQLIQPGHDFEVVATVKNYDSQNEARLIGSLFLDGRRVGQTDLTVAAGEESAVRLSGSVTQSGFHSGYVEISDDKFMPDNRYYFSFRIPERFNLLIIEGDISAKFIALALIPNETLSRYWSVKQATPDNLSGVDFSDYDVIVLAGAPSLGRAYESRLKSAVRQGRALLVSYGRETDIGRFNQVWSEVTGVTFTEPVASAFTRVGYYTFQSVNIEHPIFSVFDFANNRPPEVKFYTLPKLIVRDDVRPLMVFSGDRPALVESSFGRGKVLCFTGPMAPDYSDLSGHAFVVPFVSRLAEYLASDLSAMDLRLFCGDKITRSLALTGSINYPLELLTPDSGRFSLAPEEEQGALIVRPRPVDQAGVYSLTYLGREIDRFAVNPPSAEGDLGAADPDQLYASLGVESGRLLETDRPIDQAIATFRFGREWWQVFLWLAVVIVVVEMLLARGASDKSEPV
jgi:hypothetical protein